MPRCEMCGEWSDCPWKTDPEIMCGEYHPKPMTNADKIRSMTDEELADFVIGVLCYTKLPYMEVREKALRGNELLVWLKEEVK